MNRQFWTRIYDRAASELRRWEIGVNCCSVGARHECERWKKVMQFAADRRFVAWAGGMRDAERIAVIDATGPTDEANASLIAAAPDLLAACRTALDRFQSLEDAEEATEADIAARCAVQDAIRRAETGAP